MSPKRPILVNQEERELIIANRTYTERFKLLMKLIRIGKMLESATIIEGKTK